MSGTFDGDVDLIGVLEGEIFEGRVELAAKVDRLDALVEVLHRTYRCAQELGRPAVTYDDVFERPADEQERARLSALLNRIMGDK